MYWPPAVELLIQTSLSPAEVEKALGEITEQKKAFRFLLVGSQEKTVFEGTVSSREFYLERLAKGAIPVKGKIELAGELTLIKVNMRLSSLTLLWFAIVFMFCGFMVLAIFANSATKPVEFAPFLIPIGFCGFCLIVTVARFHSEVSKTKAILSAVLIKQKQKDAR
jgi:hypothetical protein